MLFMNEWDIETAVREFDPYVTPNRAQLAVVVSNLREWANRNSDGWCYWPKPCNAAKKAMGHIASTTNRENEERRRNDITDAQLKAALSPIKAFLTRQDADHAEVIPVGFTSPLFPMPRRFQ
jgi:hypothetical protein